jgi:hypothetical protein
MPIKRIQVQVSMSPTEKERCDELADMLTRRFGWARRRGNADRSAAVNWLIHEQLKKWLNDPQLALYSRDPEKRKAAK